ncbi:MAG: aminotransferase class I/II-fold pyridoxal phosphate-dependent enzyme, partial [Planctomycetota bacterium]|nr:aminotransferase class I/II-fold pyridoxal phosphate-dependent enzyme [Planctomycetota bacterium]
MFDADRFITPRLRAIDASGIRRVFDLGAKLKDPINLSIGQPDFDVPEPIKKAALEAIRKGLNRYTVTQGIKELQDKIAAQVVSEFPDWGNVPGGFGTLITSGVSGGLLLAVMTCAGPGDEVLIPDPFFVMYKHLVTLAGATPVYVDTYPDFQLTAERLEPLITPRTKMLLFNSPSNPTGVVSPPALCREVVELCQRRNVLLLTDEIYDEFCYEKVKRPGGKDRCPSPAEFSPDLLLLRGFSKTYAMTGWRIGYMAAPKPMAAELIKLQGQ